jgi:formylglycine-generating enzyme required for sulfatase activity
MSAGAIAMPNRRDFLRAAATMLGVGCSSLAAQGRSFRGTRAGDARTIDGIPLRWCPAGRFTMGSPVSEAGHRPDEAQAGVRISRGFWTAQHEATQGQWKRIVGAFPDRSPSAQFGEGDDFPVYWVSFHEADSFCARLTERARRAGELPGGWAFALPTEAEWEYACRAGTRTATAFGDTLGRHQANFAGETVDRRNLPTGGSRRAGRYPANAWGIHDMHGNVWEWCRDWYHARLPGGVDPDLSDVVGEANRDGTHSRVRRGGAWIEPAWACRSACRLRYEPPRRSDHIGFRVFVVQRL